VAGARGARALTAGGLPSGSGAGRTLRIGLTGPIGCGKSTVAGWLAARGAVVVDADEVARSVTDAGQPALGAVFERFGDAVRGPDGTLDRAALARIVFADPERLRQLEAIVHPAVRPHIVAAMELAAAAGAPVVAVEAIRLVEGGLAELCDEVWLIVCREEVQRARLAGRGADPADAERRIAAQAGIADRLRPAATRIIDTSADAETVRQAVEAALDEALSRDGGGAGF
jgi:dephospho-CoA kinase